MQHKHLFNTNIEILVDSEVYLHSEQDPRYRGGAIPSKAFKMLQKMTGGAPNSNQGNNDRMYL